MTTRHTLVYFQQSSESGPPRFGFIVAKTVGVAVERNLVRRRLKALTFAAIPQMPDGTEIVIRALPGAAQAGWDTLQSEISGVLGAEVRRA